MEAERCGVWRKGRRNGATLTDDGRRSRVINTGESKCFDMIWSCFDDIDID